MEEFQPVEKFIIRDLEALKVIADPLRIQLLDSLSLEPLTVKELADRHGLAASKLYYHIKLLEEHGIIQVVATRIVSGIIEKQNRATAENLEINKYLLSFRTNSGQENLTSDVTVTLDTVRDDILRSLQARQFHLEKGEDEHPREMTLIRDIALLSEERSDEFHRRLRDLLQEFRTAGDNIPNTTPKPQRYAMMLALYPTFYFEEGNLPSQGRGQELGGTVLQRNSGEL
jgi:DNA-binding transcriptional ArsR family regulator